MSRLVDEPFEKAVDDKLESQTDIIEAFEHNEEVSGTVQCQNCSHWGSMLGIIEAADSKWIKFICPKCSSLEKVRNPEYIS